MSNRLLWLLIILWFILAWILFFIYYFVYYNGIINLKWNVEGYSVELYNKKLLKTTSFDCPDKECKLEDISPFIYSISIKKNGFNIYKNDIKINRNELLELDFSLEKSTILTKVIPEEEIVDKTEKLNFLREKKKLYTFFNLGKDWIFYFKENGKNLDLYKNTKKLLELPKVAKEDIDIQKIFWIENYIFIKYWDKKYIYSIWLDKKVEVDLNIDVNYVKTWLQKKLFNFVTDKWTFIFDKYTLKAEYFSYFNDFVYYENWYIWIISKDDERRLKNLWFEDKSKNLIINYDPNTKYKKVLYETDLDITKIYKKWNDYMFVTQDDKEYKLDNF